MGSATDTIRALYKAFENGDVAAVLGAFDSDIHWNEAENFLYADGNPYVGPQAVAEGVFQRLASDVADAMVRPESYYESENVVLVEGRYQGTMIATGTPVDAQFAHVWHLEDGKILRFQQYTDTLQWANAAGR